MRPDPSIVITECEDVYSPREDSYLLIESLSVRSGERALEMGCGSGIVSAHLSKAGALVTAADLNPRAVECARRNLERNGLEGEVVLSDLFSEIEGRFDLICFNPPYLPGEGTGPTEISYAGGPSGVEVLARFSDQAPKHLVPNGRIVVLLSSLMERRDLDKALENYARLRLRERKLFFEALWTEELRPKG